MSRLDSKRLPAGPARPTPATVSACSSTRPANGGRGRLHTTASAPVAPSSPSRFGDDADAHSRASSISSCYYYARRWALGPDSIKTCAASRACVGVYNVQESSLRLQRQSTARRLLTGWGPTLAATCTPANRHRRVVTPPLRASGHSSAPLSAAGRGTATPARSRTSPRQRVSPRHTSPSP